MVQIAYFVLQKPVNFKGMISIRITQTNSAISKTIPLQNVKTQKLQGGVVMNITYSLKYETYILHIVLG